MQDDALERFIEAVKKHYQDPDAPPLLLSRFGQRNKALLADLKEAFGSLKIAVQAAGDDRIRFIDTTAGREAIAPTDIAGNLQVQIKEETASQRQAANLFESLPTPVQIAFCLRTDAGESVAVDTVRPFRFSKITAPNLLRPTQRVIPDMYRRPGLSLRTASIQEREMLWRLFLAWAEDARLDPAVFRQGGQTTALARLLAAQPAEVIPQLVIPADIAQILLKHS